MGLIARLQYRLSSEDGATAVEYALMVALIAMAVILAVTFLGQATNQTFQDVGTAVAST
jgi:pilus assembly protein Flp/PilA